MYRQLVDGSAATAGAVAEATGWHDASARRFLNELPQAERDGHGQVVVLVG